MPLRSSMKYASDSTITVSSYINRNKQQSQRQSSHKQLQKSHTQIKDQPIPSLRSRLHATTKQKLKKIRSSLLRDSKYLKSDPQPIAKNEAVTLSRKNAMKRTGPQRLATTAVTEDQQGVYRAILPIQKTQRHNYRVKETSLSIASKNFQSRNEMGGAGRVLARKHATFEPRKRTMVRDKHFAAKSYCIDTSLCPVDEPKLLFVNNVCLNRSHSFSSVSECVCTGQETVAATPAGMSWVVYGYL